MSDVKPMSMEEFSHHDGGGRGPRTEYLDWRDKGEDGDGQVDVCLIDGPYACWRFSFRRIVTFKKDGDETDKVVMYNWNCLEKNEDLIKKIKKQGYYLDSDRELEERIQAPVDPFFRFLEWLYRAVYTKEIDWLDEVFRFEPDEGDNVTVHAGGILGMFPGSWKDVDESELDDMKKAFKRAGVSLQEAYRERSTIGLKYVFVVVKAASPGDGIRVAVEAEALGNAIKKLYSDRKIAFKAKTEEERRQKADFMVQRVTDGWNADKGYRGVVLRWIYDESQDFSKKYNVVALPEEEITEEILEQVDKYREDKPELDRLLGVGNIVQLRQILESYWVHDITPPWDEIFEPAMKAFAGTDAVKDPASFDYGANKKEDEESKDEPPSQKKSTPPPAEVATVACEKCGEEMPETAMQCPHCKAEYADFQGFIGLRDVKCEACGKTRDFGQAKCQHCGAEYGVQGEGEAAKVALKPKPVEPEKPKVQASRRRVQS